MGYITITSFTTNDEKKQLIEDVEANSAEEFPIVRLVPIEANQKLVSWITQTLE
jgi:hypothetical protein